MRTKATSPSQPRSISLVSNAKLNLYLDVLRRRPDGFHELATVFERIGLADRVRLTLRRDGQIRVRSDSDQVPHDRTNLAYRGAALLKQRYRVDAGADIFISKRVPVGAGMGGGSSNAAAALVGLNRLWGLGASRKRLAALAAQIGSDVPFFIYDSPFALGRGRGERITPLARFGRRRFWHILVVPKVHVSTPRIYAQWDILSKNNCLTGLTRRGSGVKLILSALRTKGQISLTDALSNSLEPVTEQLYPQVRQVKNRLRAAGVQSILMSGSGPAVFGIVSTKKEALGIQRQLMKEQRPWQIFAVRTA